jgi:hypothetical protein
MDGRSNKFPHPIDKYQRLPQSLNLSGLGMVVQVGYSRKPIFDGQPVYLMFFSIHQIGKYLTKV